MPALLLFVMSLSAHESALLGQDPVSDLTAVPTTKEISDCTCPANTSPDVTLKGVVVDAQVILGADRRSVEERMATIFDVEYSTSSKVSGRTRIWHNVSDDMCGVSFDYGKKYSVPARWDDNGELETDKCLLGW